MLEAMLANGVAASLFPVGQIQWTTAGTYQWVCPDDVTEVAVAVVGAGSSGSQGFGVNSTTGGSGGDLRYNNLVSVTPGVTYTIVVGSGGVARSGVYADSFDPTGGDVSSALGLIAKGGVYVAGGSTPLGGAIKGFSGGYGYSAGSGTSKFARGGDAAQWTANGNTASSSSGGAGVSFNGVSRGAGGTSSGPATATGGATKSVSAGQAGGVRIIWGKNRAFPATNTGDL